MVRPCPILCPINLFELAWNTKIILGKFKRGGCCTRESLGASLVIFLADGGNQRVTMASSCGSGSSSKGSIMENVVDSITDAVDTLADAVSHAKGVIPHYLGRVSL